MKYLKVLYVDEDGVLYTKEELQTWEYETIENITRKFQSYDKTDWVIETTKRIRIKRRKATQLSLF